MTTDALISRGEFDMLAQRVTEHVRRLPDRDRTFVEDDDGNLMPGPRIANASLRDWA